MCTTQMHRHTAPRVTNLFRGQWSAEMFTDVQVLVVLCPQSLVGLLTTDQRLQSKAIKDVPMESQEMLRSPESKFIFPAEGKGWPHCVLS